MAILVVGTVALDDVQTPAGARKDALGGSATHFSVAASFFSPVRLVAVVGKDFDDRLLEPFRERGVDLAGLERAEGETFHWSGEYGDDLNDARTLETRLNVLETFHPRIPREWCDTPVVFLANIDPDLQAEVLDQVHSPRLVAADTMNYWIASRPEALKRLLGRVDVVLVNDGEARQLTGERNLTRAAERIAALGPRVVVIKRGEYGVMVFGENEIFALPAYPLRRVVDPTGAGDAFAGGFLGLLASRGGDAFDDVRRAAVAGSVMASFQVEDFSLDRLRRLRRPEIEHRYEEFRRLTWFGPLEGGHAGPRP